MPILGDEEVGKLRTAPLRRIPSGFPSPAEDSAEPPLDLHTLLVQRPAATFFLEMKGDAMRESGLYPGDILVVDRALDPIYGCIVIAPVSGELVARHWCPEPYGVLLLPASDQFAPIYLSEHERADFRVWGVVTYAIHQINMPPRYPPADVL